MRYIIETATSVAHWPDRVESHTVVYESIPYGTQEKREPFESCNKYKMVWSDIPDNPNIGYIFKLDCLNDITVTKHYDTWEDFVGDHVDLFL